MPLHRPHRGTFEESIKETQFVQNIYELADVLEDPFEAWGHELDPNKLIIKPYGFDPRCGWHTQIIIYKEVAGVPPAGVLGFLSEPFPPRKHEVLEYMEHSKLKYRVLGCRQIYAYKRMAYKVRQELTPDIRDSTFTDDYDGWQKKIKKAIIYCDHILDEKNDITESLY